MTIRKKSARQKPIVAIVPFTFADFNCVTTVANVQPAIEIPKGATVLSGQAIIDTPFNSAASDVITVGDEASANRYKAGINAQAAGVTALVPTGIKSTATTNIVVGLTPTGATMPTAGAGRLIVEYVIDGRSEFDQG